MTDKSQLRSTIFRHLDGLAVAPVAVALKNKGILQYILDHKKVSLASISSNFKSNEGYLNVGLRILASQGFLEYEIDNKTQIITIAVNEKTETAFSLFHLYDDVVELMKFHLTIRPRACFALLVVVLLDQGR